MDRNDATVAAHVVATVPVLIAFVVALAAGGNRAASLVAVIGIPLIFIFGNHLSPNSEPWPRVVERIALLAGFFGLYVGGLAFFDGRFSTWQFIVALTAWSLLLIAALFHILWRLNQRNRADAQR